MSDYSSMENILGLLRIRIHRGIDLAIRDVHRKSSDPYVIVRMGQQKLRTRVVKKSLNPEWNEELTLSIADPNTPIKLVSISYVYPLGISKLSKNTIDGLDAPSGADGCHPILKNFSRSTKTVFDKDTFSFDDKMGEAEFDIKLFIEAVKMRLEGLPNGTIITRVKPNRQNCLSEESNIIWINGKVVQKMFLRLRNVERGELELEFQWIDNPSSRCF